jgi:diaminopropionate ammonia-lyase
MFDRGEYDAVARFFAGREMTPLHDIAAGPRRVLVKDESSRFGLNAFKVAGVEFAMARLKLATGSTIVCASAGNFGRAVAHVGRRLDLRVRVYMSSATALAPRQAIESEGAEVVLIDGSYDDAVRRARDDGALVVSDTAWPGNEEIPRDIMLGYTRIMDEACEQWPVLPDIVLVQAGVGGLAAAVVSWLRDHFGDSGPFSICVEPASANPLMLSAQAGRAFDVTTPLNTIMAGLRCGEASSIAVQPLIDGCDAFTVIDDDATRDAMRVLATHGITAGPSGAAGLAALRDVDRDGVAFVINTEGATDRPLYDSIVPR